MVVQGNLQDTVADGVNVGGYHIEICVRCCVEMVDALQRPCSPHIGSCRGLPDYFHHFDCPSSLIRYIGNGRFRLPRALLALTRRADNQQDTSRH
jgi:hypothetical protein